MSDGTWTAETSSYDWKLEKFHEMVENCTATGIVFDCKCLYMKILEQISIKNDYVIISRCSVTRPSVSTLFLDSLHLVL